MSTKRILARVKSSRSVTAASALAARRAVYGDDGAIAQADMEMLFRIDEAAKTSDRAWRRLLVEAGTQYIVHQEKPSGYVDVAKVEWLVGRISKNGVVKTPTELELLVKVLEAAKSSPEVLVKFALRQVHLAVVAGEGPLADGQPEPGRVNRAAAGLVRRMLYAFGGDAGTAISRGEAEVLFDINDATAGADNDPEWTDLFVKATANCVMAASGYVVPPRAVALARERRLDSPDAGVGGFLSRMMAGGLRAILAAYTAPAADQAAGDGATTEAAWLADRIGGDGRLGESARALFRFIRDEATEIHPSLKPLIAQAA